MVSHWNPKYIFSRVDLVVDVEDKVKDVHNVGQEDKTGFLNKSYMYQLEVNLTVKSDLFGCKQNSSVDVVANFIDVMWKQEDQKKCLPTFCNLKVSQFEMGLNEDVNLTVKSDLFGCKQNPSVDGVANFIDVMWKQEDQKKCQPTFCNIKVSKFEMGLNEDFCKVETYQNIQHVGCGQYKVEEKLMDGNKKDPDKKKPIKRNKIKPSIQNKTKYGMNLELLLRALSNFLSTSTLGMILVLGLLLSPMFSLSNATKLGNCLQTSVSGFVGNGEDLVLYCKCNCSCSPRWRWFGGPNNEDLTNNQQVLQPYIDKISITQNSPGGHDYSMILKTKETDFLSSDYTCNNGFAYKTIHRSELLQHITPPIQSTVTSTTSTTEEAKTSTMSTPKPPMKNNNSKLNDGEIVGIVVGCFIMVALVAAL